MGADFFDITESTASISSSSPLPLRALVPTTGTPSSRDRAGISTDIFFLFASSMRLMQTTVRGVISIICKTRFRFRSRHVASQTTMQASAFSLSIKSRATSSSTECVKSEYVPGRSTRIWFFPFFLNDPQAVATVFPVQLPVC